MNRFMYFIRGRKFIASAIILLVVVGITVAIVLNTRPSYMSLRDLNIQKGVDLEIRKLSDYNGSKLWLHKNGTFSFKIVYKGNNEFVGIGTYKKVGKQYNFQYQDLFRARSANLALNPEHKWDENYDFTLERDPDFYNWNVNYDIVSGGRIELRCPNSRYYYFK